MGNKVSREGRNRRQDHDSSTSTISTLSKYEYQQITTKDTIRLISLLPCNESQADQRLKCELKVVSLTENPAFAALSYTWGENVFPETLVCQGKVFNITKNLYHALIHFRLPNRARSVWVDAVCINQDDDQEKSLQIPLMADIYSQATEVLIWLGPASEGSDDVMKYLKRIGQKFVDRGGEVKEPRDDRSPVSDAIWADVSGDPNVEKTHLIWERAWFTRRWVIQEMALARKAVVHCGTISMDWDVLFHACTALGHLRADGSQFWNKTTGKPLMVRASSLLNAWRLDDIRRDLRVDNAESTQRQMFDCMDRARAFDCRDAKDRVVALLGIFNRGRSDPFKVDYGDSEAKIYEKFARYCLRYGKTVDILTFAGDANHALIEGSLNLPSWVPDWRVPFRSPIDTLNGFRAGHRLSSMVELTDSSQILLARGMLVDRVYEIVSNLGSFAEPGQAARSTYMEPAHVPKWYLQVELAFVKFFMVNYGTKKDYVVGGDVWEALARTLILDRTDVIFDYQRDSPRANPSDEVVPLHEEFSGFRQHMLSKLLPVSAGNNQPSQPPLTIISCENLEYHTRAVTNSEDRCFYITKKGYIGLGPRGIKQGDVISILAGSSVPYVMRPQRDDFCMIGEGRVDMEREAYVQMPNGDLKPYILRSQEEEYRLVGECYTHGLMYGKVWDRNLAFYEDFRII